jgi:hypothetical protein
MPRFTFPKKERQLWGIREEDQTDQTRAKRTGTKQIFPPKDIRLTTKDKKTPI